VGTTPVYSLPYPEPPDPADVPTDMHELATAVETALSSLAVVPIGAIIDWPYASGNIPSWAVMPYGQALSRATYVALNTLAAAAGYPHGPGDGSTTFTLPDLRGRVLAGKDDMGGTAAGRITAAISGAAGTVLGAVVGVEGVTLVTAQMPAHNHAMDTQGSHSHGGGTGTDSPDHVHSGNTGNESADHSHSFTTGGVSGNHQHLVTVQKSTGYGLTSSGPGFAGNVAIVPGGGGTDVSYYDGYQSADHSHSGGTGGRSAAHYHSFGTSGASARHAHGITADGGHAHTLVNAGGGSVHANMSPTLIANKIMRAL
jgi:microcystin-dependent protein